MHGNTNTDDCNKEGTGDRDKAEEGTAFGDALKEFTSIDQDHPDGGQDTGQP